MAEVPAKDHVVWVQSVVADGRGSLWVADPAAPNSQKTIKDGPKLMQIDLASNAVKPVFAIPDEVAGPASYLNDVRIAPDGKFAYMSNSGQPVAQRRSLACASGDPSTQFDPAVIVQVDGKPLRRPDDRKPMFNADGIALSPDGKTLYWQELTGRTLYRIATDVLQAAKDHANAAVGKAEKVATTEPVDGLWMDKAGKLYLSSVANAVKA